MDDIHARLSELLTPLGIPACQEPMRQTVEGDYITWRVDEARCLYASGVPYIMRWALSIVLWCKDDARWPETTEQMRKLLMRQPEHKTSVWIGSTAWIEEAGRRGILLPVTVTETLQ